MSRRRCPDPRRHAYRRDLAAESLARAGRRPDAMSRASPARSASPSCRCAASRASTPRSTPRLCSARRVDPVRRERGLGLGAARPRRLCRLHAERGADPQRSSPPTHRIAALRTYVYPRAGRQDAAARAAQPERARRRRRSRGASSSPLPVGGYRLCRPCRAGGRCRTRFRRRGRGVSRHALSLGRAHQHRRSIARAWCSSRSKPPDDAAPRDADMQAAELGRATRLAARTSSAAAISYSGTGHVGIMTSDNGLPARQCVSHGGGGRAVRRGA